MREELKQLILQFVAAVQAHNEKREVFEDEVELTFENFVKWLLY